MAHLWEPGSRRCFVEACVGGWVYLWHSTISVTAVTTPCVSRVLPTWTGRAWRVTGCPTASTHQQGLLVFSQSLLGQVALPLHLQLQRLGDIGYDPVDGSQNEEDDVLQRARHVMNTPHARVQRASSEAPVDTQPVLLYMTQDHLDI